MSEGWKLESVLIESILTVADNAVEHDNHDLATKMIQQAYAYFDGEDQKLPVHRGELVLTKADNFRVCRAIVDLLKFWRPHALTAQDNVKYFGDLSVENVFQQRRS